MAQVRRFEFNRLLMVDTRGRWHGSLHELVEAFQAEVTCLLKFVTYREVVATSKRSKACEPLE